MAKKDDAAKAPSEKEPRKTIDPSDNKPEKPGDDVSDAEVNEINDRLKALDGSLEPDKVKKVDDGGNDMPKLVSSDGENLEDMDDDTPETTEEPEKDDIMDGDDKPFSDELADKIEEDEAKAKEEPEEQQSDSELDTEEDSKKPKQESSDDEDGIKDDPELDQAVKEIVAEESDVVLAAQDKSHLAASARAEAETKSKKHSGPFAGLKEMWATKRGKRIILGGVSLIILLIALIPYTRYFTLNTIGIRSSIQVRVIDSGTLQPIKNVSVRAGGADGLTDEDGIARVSGVRLGRTSLQIDKRAFAPISQAVTVGWGSNPLGEFEVEAVGSQYTFIVSDYLSGDPIARAQASSGDGNATSDEEGQFVLTLDTAELPDSAELSILISAEGYREESLNITVNNRETQEVKMVPSRKHTFVSKRSGKYDVYTAYIDTKGEDKIVGGSGLERDDIALVPHQGSDVAAFISTRENARNASGYLLSTLYIIDTASGEITKIDQSERIQIIGWSNAGRLIYVKIAAGASGTDPARHRIMSFDSKDYSAFKELAASNAFNDVIMAGEKVYFAPSNVFQEDPEPGAFVIDPNGDNKKKILDKETFGIVRSSYDVFHLNTGNDWFTYSFSAGGEAKPAESPSSQVSRIYLENPGGKSAVYIEDRDGKGTLISYDKESGKEKTILSRNGVKQPMYWLNENYLIFRVFDGTESADYALNLVGGDAKKIIDVTNTTGISRWFYY